VSPSSAHWPELSRLLDRALELPEDAREAFVEALPPEQAHLRGPLREILLQGRRRAMAGFLERLPPVGAQPLAAGGQVGPYVLLRELGRGGMGTVWLAERADGRPARRVALKFPHWAADTAGLARRMDRERDTLAALEHPHIARLYDAGVDAAGRPWLAMEYVDGVPIDAHAAGRKLGVRARLELFLQAADAVAFAHSRLVVHRDLKPANVLVSEAGEVRLLDFGIAKLLDTNRSGDPQTTELAGRAFTPDYAAPEQLGGGPVTVATDVYALGVMLHELLAGQRPYTLDRQRAGGLLASLEAAPRPRPSEAAPAELRAALRGDLDVIVGKALKLAPEERYASVIELAQDLRRHLGGLPVLARPDSVWYRATKLVGRHRLAASFLALTLAALAAGVTTSLWQAREANAARARAEALLARSAAVGEAMDHLVQQAAGELDPEALGRLVDGTAGVARASFPGAPDREALVLLALASYQELSNDRVRSLALLDRAGALLAGSNERDLLAQIACRRLFWELDGPGAKAALAELRRLGTDAALDPATRILCITNAATLAQHEAPPAEALALARAAEAALAGVKAPSLKLRASVIAQLAEAEGYANDGGARAHFEEALRILEAAGMGTSSEALQIRYGLTELLTVHGAYAEVLPHLEYILAAFAQRTPPDAVVASLGSTLEALGRPKLALVPYERAAGLARKAGNPWAEVKALAGWANALRRLGRLDEARRRADEGERAARAGLSEGSPSVVYLRYVQGLVALDAGRVADARRYLALYGQDPARLPSRHQLNGYRLRALVALAEGDLEVAVPAAQAALESARARRGQARYSLHVGRAQLLLGQVQERAGRLEEAIGAYAEAREQLAGSGGEEHPEARQAGEALDRLRGPG